MEWKIRWKMEKRVFTASRATQQEFYSNIKLFNYGYRFWRDWKSTEQYICQNGDANSARSGF